MQDLQSALLSGANNIQTILDAAAKPQIEAISLKALQGSQLPVVRTASPVGTALSADRALGVAGAETERPNL